MRKIIKLSLVITLALIAFTSCKQDTRSLDLSVPPVTTILAPQDQASYTLNPSTGPSIVFSWDAAPTPDVVLYEVAFDKPGGDFSNPVYKVLSDGLGVSPQATISQATLNTIASLAGIASLSTGTLKWAVIVSKATNAKVSTVSHTIQFARPAGFAVIPNALYLTGSATEQGTDITKAIPFKKIAPTTTGGDVIFELYTALKPGTYSLIDKNSGTPNSYSIQNNTTVVADGTTTVAGTQNVYRLTIDLGNAAATITQIVSVGLFSAPNNAVEFTLPYIGNSQWEIDNQTIVIPLESYGLDSRYKYKFTEADASGNQSVEWFGSINSDNSDPSSSTQLSYYYMYLVDNSQYNYCFKIDPSANNKPCNVNVNYSTTITNYTNSITIQ
jgi:hypothetical protein